jgi:hypothetical protein
VKVYGGEFIYDGEQEVGFVQAFQKSGQFKTVNEDISDIGGETIDVGIEIGEEVSRVALDAIKCPFGCVGELLPRGSVKEFFTDCFVRSFGNGFGCLKNLLAGGFKDTLQTAKDQEGQYDGAILVSLEVPSENFGDAPDEGDIVKLGGILGGFGYFCGHSLVLWT